MTLEIGDLIRRPRDGEVFTVISQPRPSAEGVEYGVWSFKEGFCGADVDKVADWPVMPVQAAKSLAERHVGSAS